MKLLLCLPALLWAAAAPFASAGSATWSANPGSGDYNTPANWSPATVPSAPGDTATFDVSLTTSVTLSSSVTLDSFVFSPSADAFAIAPGLAGSFHTLTFSGAGVINNFRPHAELCDGRQLPGSSISRAARRLEGEPLSQVTLGRVVSSLTPSNAGSATFINNGGLDGHSHTGAYTGFIGSASAGAGIFICNPGHKKTVGGVVTLGCNATAANGTFICNGGTADLPNAGYLQIYDTATGGDATFVLNGTDTPGASAGSLWLYYTATAGNATLIANGGAVRGGDISFYIGTPQGGTAKVVVYGNGQLDISQTEADVTIGSLEGDGLVFLGVRKLTIGSNNGSTTFSGVIQGTGGVTKIGTGTLTLSGSQHLHR